MNMDEGHLSSLNHYGQVMDICIDKLTIIDSDNCLSPGRHQAIIWTNAGMGLIGPLGTNFRKISIGIQTFSFMKMHLKMWPVKWHPFCVSFNVLKYLHLHGDHHVWVSICYCAIFTTKALFSCPTATLRGNYSDWLLASGWWNQFCGSLFSKIAFCVKSTFWYQKQCKSSGNLAHYFNSFPPGQNGRHFADDIFRCLFVNEKFWILIENSLKFVPIDNIPALV